MARQMHLFPKYTTAISILTASFSDQGVNSAATTIVSQPWLGSTGLTGRISYKSKTTGSSLKTQRKAQFYPESPPKAPKSTVNFLQICQEGREIFHRTLLPFVLPQDREGRSTQGQSNAILLMGNFCHLPLSASFTWPQQFSKS